MSLLAKGRILMISLHIDGESMSFKEESRMVWTKPEFTIVAVTLEVTAYAATK